LSYGLDVDINTGRDTCGRKEVGAKIGYSRKNYYSVRKVSNLFFLKTW
jgi:hypothetical protein